MKSALKITMHSSPEADGLPFEQMIEPITPRREVTKIGRLARPV